MTTPTYQTRMTATGECRINPRPEDIEEGDPVVSDYLLDGQKRFVPFTFRRAHDPNYTKVPWGGSLDVSLCFPYGELTDRLYAEQRRHSDETK